VELSSSPAPGNIIYIIYNTPHCTCRHIIKRLLAAGHTVHGTARHPASSTGTAHLHQMEGSTDRLKLFKADLMVPGAFDEAIAGCDMVIHTASPYQLDVPKGEKCIVVMCVKTVQRCAVCGRALPG
jgi:hypothetical protein